MTKFFFAIMFSTFLSTTIANANIIICSHGEGDNTYTVATDKKSIGVFKASRDENSELIFFGSTKIAGIYNTLFKDSHSLECNKENTTMKEWLIKGLTE